MYNNTRVLNSLFTRVGWRQPTQSEYAILAEPNTTTKSGRYFQDVYAPISIQNIKDLQEDADISDADFNEMLVNLQKAAILDMLSAVFNNREVVGTVQTYDREPDLVDSLVENRGKFVGWRIDIAKSADFVTALTQVALYFNADVTFELHCFVDNKQQPIWTKSVTATGNEVTIVDIDDLVLSYMDNKSRSTTFYIGYFQDELGVVQAYDEEVEVYNYGCLWQAQTFESAPAGPRFAIPVDYTAEVYGLNLQFTEYKDFTNQILANPSLFDTAISLQMAIKVMDMILSSTRSNLTERLTKEMLGDIYRELNSTGPTPEKPYAPGIKARYFGEISKLQKSFLGFPKIETFGLPYAVYQDYTERY